MERFYTFSAFFLFIALVLAILLAIYAWRRRTVPGGRAFFWFMLVITGWMASSVLAITSPTPQLAIFWFTSVRYVFVALLSVTMLAFALEYTGRDNWLTPLRLAVLLILPITTQIINWFGPNWFIYDEVFQRIGPFLFLMENGVGFWFWVHTAYAYILTFSSMGIFAVHALRSGYPYRGQSLILLLGSIVPMIVNIILVARLLARVPPDLTALSFTVTGIVWAFALFQFGLLKVAPVARDLVIESMDDAVIVLDPTQRIVDINPAALHVFNVERSDVIGKTPGTAVPDHKPLIERFTDVETTRTEITLLVEGEKHHFDLNISPVASRRGRGIGRLIVLRDITARKQAELEREQLISELNAYAQTVAHDLKSPLGLMVNAAEFLDMEGGSLSEDKQSQYRNIIIRMGRKMNGIIESLLLLARLRESDFVPITTLDMAPLVEDALERVSHHRDEHAAVIILPDQWPEAMGYGPWVEEVWANYLSNAIKYGGEQPQVKVGGERTADGMVRFFVRDNGPGLTADEQAAIFVPFTRLEGTPSEGHGLGLSIVRRIVDRLGGEVGLESSPGKGSTFTFTLPATPD